jgi:recombinational DNA repair protein (RecF pathway)
MYTWKPGAELAQLSEAYAKEAFEGLRRDFELFALASVLNELMLRVAPQNQSCLELFKLHSNALVALNELALARTSQPSKATPTPSQAVEFFLLNAYLAKLLQWSGNQPRLLDCSGCGSMLSQMDLEAELCCTIASAGWICPECRTQKTAHIREREGLQFDHMMLRITPLAIVDFHTSLHSPIRKMTPLMKASDEEHRSLFKFLEALFVYHVPGFDRQPLKSLRFIGL